MTVENKIVLHRAESGFALLRENVGNDFSLRFFDLVIAVEKLKPKLVRDRPTHRRLAGAHEPDEIKVNVCHRSPRNTSIALAAKLESAALKAKKTLA